MRTSSKAILIAIGLLTALFQNCAGKMRGRPGSTGAAIADAANGTQLRNAAGGAGAKPRMSAAQMLAIMLPAIPAQGGTTSGGTSAGACRMPRYYSFDLTSDVPLGCDYSWEGRTDIFKPVIDDEGMALVRATLQISKSSSNGPGGWSAGVYAGVGGGVTSDMADNINPGDTQWKTVLGSGELSKAYTTAVRLSGYNYSAYTCVKGDFTVKAGSRLEVWVEDPRAECRGKYVGLKSLYTTQKTHLTWGTDTMSMDIPQTSDGNQILLLSSIEGTLMPCASGTLSTHLSSNLFSMVGTGASSSVPTAQQKGQCHLSLSTADWTAYSPALTNLKLNLLSGVSSPVYSGYLDGNGTGEGVVGFVKQ